MCIGWIRRIHTFKTFLCFIQIEIHAWIIFQISFKNFCFFTITNINQ